EDRERLAAVIRNDVKRIDRLITDISDASRLDAELYRGEAEPVDVVNLLDTLMSIYNGMDLERGNKVAFTPDSAKSAVVQALDRRLGQVFRNLIDNAVSFSPENGIVHVGVYVSANHVRCVVEDDGPGIPDE